MKKLSILMLFFLTVNCGCTWQDTAKIKTNAAVCTAMIATGNAGDFNMNADLAGQAAEGLVDMSFEAANGTCSDSDLPLRPATSLGVTKALLPAAF